MMTADAPFQPLIRAATPEDLPACLNLDSSFISEYVWQVEAREMQNHLTYSFRTVRLPRPMTVALPQPTEVMLAAWQRRDYFVVAEHDETILAYLTMQTDQTYGIGWIREMVVDARWRRRRVGSALLSRARRWAQANKLRRITAEAQTKNYPAIAFCQRNGLTFCGFNDRYYPNHDIALFFTQSIR